VCLELAGRGLTIRAAEEVVALAKRCPRRPPLIDLSSNLVYTPPREGELPSEDHPCSPETVHGRNKRAAEVMFQESGLLWVLLRLGQVYGGPGSTFDWVMVDPVRKQEFPAPCAGDNRVALEHLENVVPAVRRMIHGSVRNRAFNIAVGDPALTLGQVFDEVAKGFRLPPPRRLPLAGALVYAWFSEHGARLLGREPKLVVDMIRVLSANRSLDISRARAELSFEPAGPDTLAGIRAAYGPVFTGERPVFNPGGRLSAALGRRERRVLAEVVGMAPWGAGKWHLRRRDAGAARLRGASPRSPRRRCRRNAGRCSTSAAAPGRWPVRWPRALTARGGSLGEYIGVDYGDAAFLTARVDRELEREGVRGRFIAHDLAVGLPPLCIEGPLLVTSCWGVTYLPLDRLGGVIDALAALNPASVCINLISAGKFDRSALWGQTVNLAFRT